MVENMKELIIYFLCFVWMFGFIIISQRWDRLTGYEGTLCELCDTDDYLRLLGAGFPFILYIIWIVRTSGVDVKCQKKIGD